MKQNLKVMLAVFSLLLSMQVYAAAWTAGLESQSIRVHPSYVAVYLNTSITAPDTDSSACAGSVIAINRNSAIYDDALAILLAANIAKQKVKFLVAGCNWGYMEANVIWLNQP